MLLAESAVINAGPLVALSLADRLDLLPALFPEFWIPDPVYHEVTVAGWGRPGAKSLATPDWLSRVRQAPTPDPLLVAELDPGEAAVIALARSIPPAMVVIDEKRGRRVARQVYGLTVKGTAGLLVEAHRRGLVTDLRGILLDLRKNGYYLSDAVIEGACAAALRA
jgi:predicted nucleic acid-binding protein